MHLRINVKPETIFEVPSKSCGKFDSLMPEVATNPVFEKFVIEYERLVGYCHGSDRARFP
jgi:hypothetical protein